MLVNSVSGYPVRYVADDVNLFPNQADCYEQTRIRFRSDILYLPVLEEELKVRLKSDIPDDPRNCVIVEVDDPRYDGTTKSGWVPYLCLRKTESGVNRY